MPRQAFQEYNAVLKDASKVDVLFGYCYPSTYRAGMTGLATHLFYSALNSRDDTSCERYFRYDTQSPVHSVESGRPLGENHIVGFSLTYEEDIVNLVQMLEAGEVPVFSKDRTPDDPLVVVGGPVVSANPEPYADLIDAFAIGDGDLLIHEIVDRVRGATDRSSALEALAGIPGIYVPSSNGHSRIKRIALPCSPPHARSYQM